MKIIFGKCTFLNSLFSFGNIYLVRTLNLPYRSNFYEYLHRMLFSIN